MVNLINKIRYKYYSRYYKNVSKDVIKTIKEFNINTRIYLARQNGKALSIIFCHYIHAVENYEFKFAKILLKNYKKYFKKKLLSKVL